MVMDISEEEKNAALTVVTGFADSIQTTADEIVAEYEGTPRYQAGFKRMFYAVVATVMFEYTDGKLNRRHQEERNAVVNLVGLGKAYAEELSKCGAAEAHLSRLTMACSVLEVLLMLSCIRFKQEVSLTKAWKKAAKKAKRKSFVATLQDRNISVSVLIDVALELGWFGTELPPEALNDMTAEERELFTKHLPSIATAMRDIPSLAKNIRNMLHPGKCLRDGIDLQDKEPLLAGAVFAATAMIGYVVKHAEEPGA